MLTKRARHGGRRTRVPTLSWTPHSLSSLFLSLSQLPPSREDNFFSYLLLFPSPLSVSSTFSLSLSFSRSFLLFPLFIVVFFPFFVVPSFSSLLPLLPRFARSSALPLITGRGRRASKRNPVRTVVVPCGRTWIIVGCYRDTECTGWWTGLETTTTVRHRHGSWGGCWFRRKGEPVRPIGKGRFLSDERIFDLYLLIYPLSRFFLYPFYFIPRCYYCYFAIFTIFVDQHRLANLASIPFAPDPRACLVVVGTIMVVDDVANTGESWISVTGLSFNWTGYRDAYLDGDRCNCESNRDRG